MLIITTIVSIFKFWTRDILIIEGVIIRLVLKSIAIPGKKSFPGNGKKE